MNTLQPADRLTPLDYTPLRARIEAYRLGEPKDLRGPLFLLALALTVVGSFLDLQFGGLLADLFHIAPMQLRHGVLAFSIVPSSCVLLLFPVLTLLSETGARRTGRTL